MEKVNYQVAEIEISYRPKFKVAERPMIISSGMAYKICWLTGMLPGLIT
ncbi:hypothetical protein [Pedobacter psychrodurus]|nr:hypothetical protein [Pedobacter psychrodurus]